jgi:hypothetical protein
LCQCAAHGHARYGGAGVDGATGTRRGLTGVRWPGWTAAVDGEVGYGLGGGGAMAAGEGDGDSSATEDLRGRWEGVRRSGRRTKQWWRCLTVDEVDDGFTGAALKMNTSTVNGDLQEEEDEVELRLVA